MVGLIRKSELCICVFLYIICFFRYYKINPSLIPWLRSTWIERGSWRVFLITKTPNFKNLLKLTRLRCVCSALGCGSSDQSSCIKITWVNSIIRIQSPKLTNHQVKIQHLDQTITVAKYPKEAGTSEKWPRGAYLCHTLMGALWTIAQETPFHPTHSLQVAIKV